MNMKQSIKRTTLSATIAVYLLTAASMPNMAVAQQNTDSSSTAIISESNQQQQKAQTPLDKDISYLQKRWAYIKYQIKKEKEQEKQMSALSEEASLISSKYPNRAEPKIWEAIIVSTQAGIKGGLGALGLVKKAKKLLEQAIKIDPKALDGSAYTSLGSLYYQVPSWPIGFGDNKKARAYLEQARSINPNGIDPNYFYGDFLFEEGKYQQALEVLEHALKAPDRPNRPIADAGRREEIKLLIEKIRKKM